MESGKTGRRRVLYLLLSILVACGIWLYVDLSTGRTVTQDFTDIPIEFIYENTLTDRGLMLVEEGTDLTIDLKLKGTRWDISNLDRSQIRVTVSLADITRAGEQRVNWTIGYTNSKKFNSSTVQTESASIRMATVNISELYSRTINVRCDLVGKVAESYTAGQIQLSHPEVEIRGLQEDIDPISYAKVTLDIGDSATETVSQDLEIQYYDRNDQLLDKSGVHTNVETVRATMPVSVTKELELVVNFTESPGCRVKNTDYTISPSTITVSGDATQLKNVNTLELGNYNLAELGTVASQNYTTTNYAIILPEGCQNLSGVTRAALRIRFENMASATLNTENITWSNLPEDKQVELLTSSLPVKVFGTREDIAVLTEEDLSVKIDLGDYSAASGTYTVPAEVRVGKGDIGISGEYQIQVTIRESAEELENPVPPDEAE